MAIAKCYAHDACRICGLPAAAVVWLQSETGSGTAVRRLCSPHADQAERSPRFIRREPIKDRRVA